MEHQEGTFQGTGGLELFHQRWRGASVSGEDTARAALAIVHGFGEHSGRYMNLVRHLVPLGFAVHAFDNRGFGRSSGQKGHIDAWSEYRGDVDAFLRQVRADEAAECPLFLMGHSMGGLIVLDFILRDASGLRGTILSAPGLRPVGVAKPHLVLIAKFLSRLWPRFSLDIGLDAPSISRDPAVVQAYLDDPLCHARGTVRWGTESLAAIDWIWRHADNVNLPLLLVQGGGDRLVAADGARDFFDRVSFADKELHIYEDVFHEPHNDLDHEQAAADLASWLERHLP